MDKKKTTMSVPEMRRMLGLRKTDSYWLVHKQCFETVMVKGKMRIVIDSFEHWYANQVKYKKVDGPPPGEELRSYSYSPQELAEKLNGGDIKSVQGDSGHAQAQMVTDQYSHILDDDRKNNAALFERAFYSGKGVESVEAPAEPEDKGPAAPAGVDPELLAKILSNPEMAALLTSLAKSLN